MIALESQLDFMDLSFLAKDVTEAITYTALLAELIIVLLFLPCGSSFFLYLLS